jgi:ribonucleotide reductase alpha subunit
MFPFSSSGEFVVVNKHLLHDLTEMGVWTPTLKNQIIYEDGSVQKMTEIPDDLKAIYKYVVQPLYHHILPNAVTVSV